MKNNPYDSFDPMYDIRNYIDAFRKCRKGTSWKKSIQKFGYNLIPNSYNIINKLKNKTFKPPKPVEFLINERGKERHIRSISIEERTPVKIFCQHILAPTLLKQLIYHNSACIKGKGVFFAREQLKKQLRNYYHKYGHKGYVLLIDFSKFFQHVDHDILYDKLFKLFKNPDVRWFLKTIIDAFGDKGLCLGSELSQLLATWYPNDIDHLCKERLHIKGYGRYMDDIYLICHDKKYLETCRQQILNACDKLKIIVNDKKTKFCQIENGFVFLQCNFRLTPSGKVVVKPSKKNAKRIRRKLTKLSKFLQEGRISFEDVRNTYMSYSGHLKGTNHYKMKKNIDNFYIKTFNLDMDAEIAYNYAKTKRREL